MDLLTIFLAVLYCAVGWFLADTCTDGSYSAQFLCFIAWPLIIGTLLLLSILLLICGFIMSIAKLIFGEDKSDAST